MQMVGLAKDSPLHPKFKPALKTVFRAVSQILPPRGQIALQTLAERVIFRLTSEVHDLPPIFHYWSNRYLRPRFEKHGFSSPNDFFFHQLVGLSRTVSPMRILALGSGRADLELTIAHGLIGAGFSNFIIHGIDLTRHAVDDARRKAHAQGLGAHFVFAQGDLNTWKTEEKYDAVLANHCLHHVVQLESLFAQVKRCLSDSNGLFLVADMIGRNGHQLWPEALVEVRNFWRELPPAKRLDRATGCVEPEFVNYDCSKVGFEGIRAQDILSLLVEYFEFEMFLPHCSFVTALIERRTGWNFNVNDPLDLDFVDRLEAQEQLLMKELKVKPTQMLAAMRPQARMPPVLLASQFTPQACIRWPN